MFSLDCCLVKPIQKKSYMIFLSSFIVLFFIFKVGFVFAHGKKAHVHGMVDMDFSIDENGVQAHVDAPLDSVVGFERAPRTDAEKSIASSAIKILEGGGWVNFSSSAQCSLFSSKVQIDVLTGNRQPNSGHADAGLHITWRCIKPEAIKEISLKWFENFQHTDVINIQLLSLQGQSGKKIRRGQSEKVEVK